MSGTPSLESVRGQRSARAMRLAILGALGVAFGVAPSGLNAAESEGSPEEAWSEEAGRFDGPSMALGQAAPVAAAAPEQAAPVRAGLGLSRPSLTVDLGAAPPSAPEVPAPVDVAPLVPRGLWEGGGWLADLSTEFVGYEWIHGAEGEGFLVRLFRALASPLVGPLAGSLNASAWLSLVIWDGGDSLGAVVGAVVGFLTGLLGGAAIGVIQLFRNLALGARELLKGRFLRGASAGEAASLVEDQRLPEHRGREE